MKRDLEVCRAILLKIEGLEGDPYDVEASALEIEGVEPSVVVYHVALLVEAELVHALDTSTRAGEDYSIGRLTWKGHEFVDAARDNTRWQKLKRAGMQAVNAAGLATVTNWLQAAAGATLTAFGGGTP